MRTVKSKITYKEKASRLELLVRIIYAIPIAVILWILDMVGSIVGIVLWLYMLILGKRHKLMTSFLRMVITYRFRTSSYLWLATDDRPPIIPEKV